MMHKQATCKTKVVHVKTKVLCSIVPPMFHLLEQRQVVDFKGFLTLFSINVPLFHNIYKGRRIAKYFTMLSGSGRFRLSELWLGRSKHGTMEQERQRSP